VKVDVVPYRPVHAYAVLDANVRHQNVMLSQYPGWDVWAVECQKKGPAYTLLVDDHILGCGGVAIQQWHKAEGWLLLSGLAKHYPKILFRTVKTKLAAIAEEYRLKRVQGFVRPDFAPGIHFLEHLGFRHEGRLEAFGPNGEDYLIFARIY
jgi:RimJ/RimL family protein N-acetyltransferase